MRISKNHWRILGIFCFLALIAWLILAGIGSDSAEAAVAAVGDAGWLAFFSAMTLLPLLGFPVTPFYIVGGAVFGEWACLAGSAVSLAINMAMAYVIAARWMRTGWESLLSSNESKLKPMFNSRRHTWLYILTVRVTPGPPLSFKNYLAGISGTPFVPYMLISWPIAMGYAAGLIILGDSMTEQRWFGAIVGIILLCLFLLAMYLLQAWLRQRDGATKRDSGVKNASTSAKLILLAAVGCAFAINPGAHAGRKLVEHRFDFDNGAQFDDALRCRGIDVLSVPGVVRLAPVETFSPSPAYVMQRDRIAPNGMGRFDFHISGKAPVSGELLIYGSGTGLVVNGTNLSLSGLGYGGWMRASLEPGLLVQGINRVILPPGLTIGRDPQAVPSRMSYRRSSPEDAWESANGEYLVRLRLFRHPPEGTLTSKAIDLLHPDAYPAIVPFAETRDIRIDQCVDAPEGTQIEILFRTGPTITPDESWSAWSDTRQPPPARFLQWRARLSTTCPDTTPELRSLRISASLSVVADASEHGLRITDWDVAPVIRGSYPYVFQEPSARLRRLREEWQLDDIIAGANDQLEAFILLRNWVRNQWAHNDAGARDRTWDAIDILTAPEGQKGMCSHFAVLFTQCALALGYVSRHVILNSHFVADIWSDDLRQWILVDVETVQSEGWERYGTAIYRDAGSGRPLDVLDLHRATYAGKTHAIVQELAMRDEPDEHRVYPRKYDPDGYAQFMRFAYPKRNNYLDQLEPWEESWGFDHYHSDAFMWWRNDARGHTPAFTWQTGREADVRWTVNTTAIRLGAMDHRDKLEVLLDTVTPNFKAFLIQRDNDAPLMIEAPGKNPHERQARWIWRLQRGHNRLEVRSINLFEREGSISSISVFRE